MKISTTRTLILEQFPAEIKSWLPKLITPLNAFLEQVYKALVNGLTIKDNLKSQLNENIAIGVQQTYPMKLAWNLNEKPTIVVLGALREEGASSTVLPQHSFQWEFDQQVLKVTLIGLDSTKQYRATIWSQV